MGVVYRAHDTLLERVVALKVIATSINDNVGLRERFFREARAAGQLSHPNVITIHDLGEHEGQPYLAMEYLVGEDLQRRLMRADPMSLGRKVQIASEICDGLSFAHRRGVIHRDIKPANIFIADDGVVKILDFGLARMVASEVTASNMMLGTLNYMAPEQVRGERIDHRADIFSYGALLYEILSGRKAFQGDSYATTLYKILQETPEPLTNIDPSLPPELVRIVDKALAKSRDERYQDLTEVAVDLALLKQQLSSATGQTLARSASIPRTYGAPSGSIAFQQAGPESETTTAFTTLEPPVKQSEPSAPTRHRIWSYAAVLAIGVVGLAGWLAFGRSTPPRPKTPPLDLTAPPPSSAPSAGIADPQPTAPPSVETAKPSPPALEPTAVDDARARMTRAKAAANAAGASARRSTVYSAALQAEREATALQRAGRVPEATAKFYEASGLYTSALVPATSAATTPPSPPPSSPAAPSGTQAASTGTQAVAPPAAAAPPETAPPTPSSTTASTPKVTIDPLKALPPPVTDRLPPPPPVAAEPPSVASAEDAIRALVRRYEQALETRNIDALKRIWPSLAGGQEVAIRREFEHARSIEVTIEKPTISVSGTAATVTFTRGYQLLTVDGQRLLTNSLTTIAARRAGSEWVIDSVRFQAK